MEIIKNSLLKKFGEHIKNLRVESGLTQDEVVLNSNRLTKATVSDIENGKRNLSFTTLIDLAKGMNRHPKELFDFEFDIEKYKIEE
ncbi:helix-turn-helix transcriptional regulator [Weeksellaceae bacterium A-14]